jgi:hypothetical protein
MKTKKEPSMVPVWSLMVIFIVLALFTLYARTLPDPRKQRIAFIESLEVGKQWKTPEFRSSYCYRIESDAAHELWRLGDPRPNGNTFIFVRVSSNVIDSINMEARGNSSSGEGWSTSSDANNVITYHGGKLSIRSNW